MPETQSSETSDGKYNPHSVPFLNEVDEEGTPLAFSREDALASALHMVLHVFYETSPAYEQLLAVIKAGVEKEKPDKTYTRDEIIQVLGVLQSMFGKLVEEQFAGVKEITDRIPKKETGPTRAPTYFG